MIVIAISCIGLFHGLQCAMSNPLEGTNPMSSIRVMFHRSLSPDNIVTNNISLNKADEIVKLIDPQKPFVLYIHGFTENSRSISVHTVVQAHLQRGTDNIAVLDWGAYSQGSYLEVAPVVKEIAKYAGEALNKMVSSGLKVETLQLVGQSLGAQICGFIGRYTNFVIPRITGLDPANPLFYQSNAEHINATSAKQVNVLHTDGGLTILSYGTLTPTGTADFYANGGFGIQPGCPSLFLPNSDKSFCSHERAWMLYAESVLNEDAFPALQCGSYDEFSDGKCTGNNVAYFGPKNTSGLTGKYYFMTNAESSFSKGLKGITRENRSWFS